MQRSYRRGNVLPVTTTQHTERKRRTLGLGATQDPPGGKPLRGRVLRQRPFLENSTACLCARRIYTRQNLLRPCAAPMLIAGGGRSGVDSHGRSDGPWARTRQRAHVPSGDRTLETAHTGPKPRCSTRARIDHAHTTQHTDPHGAGRPDVRCSAIHYEQRAPSPHRAPPTGNVERETGATECREQSGNFPSADLCGV